LHIVEVIRSFRDREVEALFERRFVKRFSGIERQARRKLEMLEAAKTLAELRSPPGNRLEALARDRQGQHSIRINDQWRICFVWRQDGAYEVEIVDYH
jgi:toxin HigB-1